MPAIKLKLGGQTFDILNGDLKKYADSALDAAFTVAQSEITRFNDDQLSQLPSDHNSLTGQLTIDHNATWKLGTDGNVTFGFAAGALGTLEIKKSGELFSYTQGYEEINRVGVTVPPGFACVIISLKVTLGVEGGAAFSSGGFGVSANLSSSLTFNLRNYKIFPQTMNVGDAVHQAFDCFILPFKTSGFKELNNGDFVEYEFVGKLGLGFGVSYGLSGISIGGRSMSELNRSFTSPIGELVVGLNPTFSADAEFSVAYSYENAYRIIAGRRKDAAAGLDQLMLSVFKMDTSGLALQFNAGITISAGAQFSIELKLDQIIDDAANKLFGDLPAGLARDAAIRIFKENLKKEEHKRELEKYIKKANEEVAKLLRRVNNQKIALQVLHERTHVNTVLFNVEFDLRQSEAMSQGFAKAMAGDYQAAMKVPGVKLLPGSFIEEVFIRKTTLKFLLFDFFKVTSVTEYYQKAVIVYAGDGVFKLRYLTGVKHEEGHIGHERRAEVYFAAAASTSDFRSVDNLDVKLHFILIDHANRKSARQTVGLLNRIGGPLGTHADRILATVEHDASLTVKARCVFDRAAYERLQSDDFINDDDDRPPRWPQSRDRRNWDEFVRALEEIDEQGYLEEGFPNLVQSFDSWALFNRTATDQENSSRPPNRRRPGNLGNQWPSEWINVGESTRRTMKTYLEAGRGFLNLCDDLKRLAQDLEEIHSDEQYRRLLKSLNQMVHEDFKVWFVKTTLLALFRLTGGQIRDVQGPAVADPIDDVYAVSFTVTG
jgi:hypothetical protein